MGKVRNSDIRQFNALKQWLRYRVDLKAHLSMSRLKRVVKGRHWRKNRRTKIYNHFKDYYKCYAWNKQSNNKQKR